MKIETSENTQELDLTGRDLYYCLKQKTQSNFVSGLPCGELKGFIAESNTDKEILHLPATNERESVGIAVGAWLAGKNPSLYMQNSGFFEASNDIGSLLIACRIPLPVVVAWRGAPGETATQHLALGEATMPLLDSLKIPYITKASAENISDLVSAMAKAQMPGVVLQRKEKINSDVVYSNSRSENREIGQLEFGKDETLFSREEIIAAICQNTPKDTAVISSTGLISRSVFQFFDGENQFYNAGGFGLTSSIGLGLSMSLPEKKVVVIEGDGSVLTDMGNLNLIGHYQPKGLIHIVLDNNAYGSCSGEKTIGSDRIPYMAAIMGYKNVYSVSSLDEVKSIYSQSLQKKEGPVMIHVKINTVGRRDLDRPIKMAENARRFRAYNQQNA